MNIFANNLFVDSNFVVFSAGRSMSKTVGSTVYFSDGSSADLTTGTIHIGGDGSPITIVQLMPGKNELSFGSLNNNPQTLSWPSQKLAVNYPGRVEIHEGKPGEIRVEENQFCHAKIVGQSVNVALAEYYQITIVKAGSNQVAVSGNNSEFPTLHIWAPDNVQIQGSSESINFVTAETIEMNVGTLSGNQITKSLKINTAGDISVALSSCPSIALDSSGDVTCELKGNTPQININSAGGIQVKFQSINKLAINTSGDVEVTGNSIERFEVDTAGDVDLSVSSFGYAEIDTSGDVNLTSDNGTQNVTIDTAGDVKLTLAIANKVSVDTSGDVTIRAFTYLTDPEVDTAGDEKIRIRK